MSADDNPGLQKNDAELITPGQFFTGGPNGTGQYHSIGANQHRFASNYPTANDIHTMMMHTSEPASADPIRRRSKDSKSHSNRSINGETNRTPLARAFKCQSDAQSPYNNTGAVLALFFHFRYRKHS